MHIYMVRHGQSQHNAHQVVAGQQESPLTRLGEAQARQAGQEAAGLNIGLIVCSPMGRAQQTARLIADAIGYPRSNIRTVPELRERNLGALEGTSYARNPRRNGNYRATEAVAGVEPIALLHQRVNHVLRDLTKDSRVNVLIVCHMNIGRMLHAIVQGRPPLGMYDTPRMENAKIYQLL